MAHTAPTPDWLQAGHPAHTEASLESTGQAEPSEQVSASQPPPLRSKDPHLHPHPRTLPPHTTHQEEGRADKLPAESPVQAGLEPHHLLDVVAEPVHTCVHTGRPVTAAPTEPGATHSPLLPPWRVCPQVESRKLGQAGAPWLIADLGMGTWLIQNR